MAERLAHKLKAVLQREESNLREITEAQSAERPKVSGWSRKEELGHLIDSAVNNHVRFVAASLQPEFHGPGYEQDAWVRAHGYHQMEWGTIIELWLQHNLLLVNVILRLPDERLATPCHISGGPAVMLGFVIEDYILHMQHHLDHVLARESITTYPSQK